MEHHLELLPVQYLSQLRPPVTRLWILRNFSVNVLYFMIYFRTKTAPDLLESQKYGAVLSRKRGCKKSLDHLLHKVLSDRSNESADAGKNHWEQHHALPVVRKYALPSDHRKRYQQVKEHA